jgi:predicted transcriptional regulator
VSVSFRWSPEVRDQLTALAEKLGLSKDETTMLAIRALSKSDQKVQAETPSAPLVQAVADCTHPFRVPTSEGQKCRSCGHVR